MQYYGIPVRGRGWIQLLRLANCGKRMDQIIIITEASNGVLWFVERIWICNLQTYKLLSIGTIRDLIIGFQTRDLFRLPYPFDQEKKRDDLFNVRDPARSGRSPHLRPVRHTCRSAVRRVRGVSVNATLPSK